MTDAIVTQTDAPVPPQLLWQDDTLSVYVIHVPLPNSPLKNLNSYVLKTPGQTLIIDTGFHLESCRRALFSGLEALQVDFKTAALFLTHLHGDHCGLIGDFMDRGVPAYMGELDYAYSRTNDRFSAVNEVYQREGFPCELLERQKSERKADGFSPREGYTCTPLKDGDLLPLGVPAVARLMPGHTPGQMVLYLPEQELLFTGDHVLFDITPNINIWNGMENPLKQYLESLERIRSFRVKEAFPAHRSPKGSFYDRVDALIEHHAERLNEIEAAVKAMPGSTAYELAGRITWSARGLGWEAFPAKQKWFATGETLAHLTYLTEAGRITRTEREDSVVYE